MASGADAPSGTVVVPDIDPAADGYTAASLYARGGMYVIPVRPRTKHPGSYLGKAWPSQSTRSGADIYNLWMEDHPEAGPGIHAGRSGLVVFDVDKPDKLPDLVRRAIVEEKPPFQNTRDTGQGDTADALALADGQLRGHALFRVPEGRMFGNSLGTLPPGWGDIRGSNGFIVTANSVHEDHATGGRYRWLRTGAVPVLPQYLARHLPDGGDNDSVASDEQVEAFKKRHSAGVAGAGRKAVKLIDAAVKRFTDRVAAGHGRHTEAAAVATWMAREAASGAYPAGLAFADLYRAFEDLVRADRGARPESASLKREFAGIVAWAVGQALVLDPARVEQVRERTGVQPSLPLPGLDAGPVVPEARKPLEPAQPVPAGTSVRDLPPAGMVGGNPAGGDLPPGSDGDLWSAGVPDVPPADTQALDVWHTPPGADLALPGPGEHEQADEADHEVLDFWSRRKVLTHIRQYALARYASPWAALGVVLSRVVAATGPQVQLPPTVGGYGSLNLFVALVARSGGGKGAAEAVGEECVEVDPRRSGATTNFPKHALGSGEGLAHMFMKRTKPSKEEPDPAPYQYNVAALVTLAEIDTFGALSSRNGSTLAGQIRQAAMGEQLGFFYVDKDKRMLVPPHFYRLCLLAGVQPRKAGVLLDDADGGTPQRFLWLPASNPDAPDEELMPECPEPLLWQAPAWPLPERDGPAAGRTVLTLPDEAVAHTRALRLAHLRGEGDPLDGHTNLTRLKVAAALAILDGRAEVSAEDWELSATVMHRSGVTRGQIVAALAEEARDRNELQAHAEAARELVKGERIEAATRKKMTSYVTRQLAKVPAEEWVTRSTLMQNLSKSEDRAALPVVLEALEGTGQIERLETVRRGRVFEKYRRSVKA